MSENFTGVTQVESYPQSEFDVVNKGYVDVTHQSAVEEGETGPAVFVRAGLRAVFIWWEGFTENVAGHGYYQVQMATDAAFTAVVDDLKTKSTWTTFDGLTSGVTYHWRVRAVDAAGNVGSWTGVAPSSDPDLATDADINDVNVNKLTAGSIQVATYIEGNYTAGSGGWHIDGSGNAEFNNVTIRGLVTASVITGSEFFTAYSTNDVRVAIGEEDLGDYIQWQSRALVDDATVGNDWISRIFTTADGRIWIEGSGGIELTCVISGEIVLTGTTKLNGGLGLSDYNHAHNESGTTSGPSPTSTAAKPVFNTGGPSSTTGAFPAASDTHSHEVLEHSHGLNGHTHTFSI